MILHTHKIVGKIVGVGLISLAAKFQMSIKIFFNVLSAYFPEGYIVKIITTLKYRVSYVLLLA